MKKLVLLIALLSLPIISISQEKKTTVTNDISLDKVVKNTYETKTSKENDNSTAIFKAKLIELNYRKSNDIISIKAYRKSLQIKVKTIKLC